jgi:predicted metal-binding protein
MIKWPQQTVNEWAIWKHAQEEDIRAPQIVAAEVLVNLEVGCEHGCDVFGIQRDCPFHSIHTEKADERDYRNFWKL